MKVKPDKTTGTVTVVLRAGDESLLEKSTAAASAAASPLRLKRILVPVDFSDFSTKALDYALAFAEQFGATLLLVHVLEPVIIPDANVVLPPSLDTLDEDMARSAAERLTMLQRDRIGRRAPTETCVRRGRAFNEIVEAAREQEADLIILGTHGYTGLKHVLLGSVAERVVRHAPCPVLVVRPEEHEFVQPRS